MRAEPTLKKPRKIGALRKDKQPCSDCGASAEASGVVYHKPNCKLYARAAKPKE